MQFHVIEPVCASDAERSAHEVITREVICVVSPGPDALCCQPWGFRARDDRYMSEAFRAARQLHAAGQREVVREVTPDELLSARLGVRDPVR
jgi:hypothetical protein